MYRRWSPTIRTSSTPGSTSATCTRGYRKYDEAIEYFKKALELKPDYDLPVINMANAYRQLGRDDAALAGYEHYLTIDPKNAHVRYQMGEIYLDRGDMARAEQNFQQAAGDRPARGLGAERARRDRVQARRPRRPRSARCAPRSRSRSDVRLAHYNLALIAEERNDLGDGRGRVPRRNWSCTRTPTRRRSTWAGSTSGSGNRQRRSRR